MLGTHRFAFSPGRVRGEGKLVIYTGGPILNANTPQVIFTGEEAHRRHTNLLSVAEGTNRDTLLKVYFDEVAGK